jgi:uncharacterized iron-regulated membrane protein
LRAFWTLVHRWVGLTIAGFLFVSGLTGAIISWDHELDDLLNPQLMSAAGSGPTLSPLQLAKDIEARDPRIRVSYIPLQPEAGASLGFGVDPRVDPKTQQLYEPGYNELFIDPHTGAELGRREWGAAWPLSRENFVSFLYVLHYTLHIPEMWGIDRWGVWLLGSIAVLWTLDCFVGFYLTLPAKVRTETVARSWWERWKPAWLIRWRSGSTKLNFDLHRAFSLWTWIVLFVVAFTAFSLNLYNEVFYPLMSRISVVTPSPFDTRTIADKHHPIAPVIGYDDIVARASTEARNRGWEVPVGGVFYSQEFGIYGVSFFEPGGDHGAAGVGPPYLYYDSGDGRLLGDRQPWKGTVADIFVQAQFPLHSGRILGLPGRILISIMGLVVATLSVTGVIIWLRKRSARQRSTSRKLAPQSSALADGVLNSKS